jgi:hypothetical protein
MRKKTSMPASPYQISETHGSLLIPDRSTGLVRVSSHIPLRTVRRSGPASGPEVDLTMTVRRDEPGQYFASTTDGESVLPRHLTWTLEHAAWAAYMEALDAPAVQDDTKPRMLRVSELPQPAEFPLPDGLSSLTLSMSPKHLVSVHTWLRGGDQAELDRALWSLRIHIFLHFFPPELKKWTMGKRPRGTHAKDPHVSLVTREVRMALYWAEDLVTHAWDDAALRDQILAVLTTPHQTEEKDIIDWSHSAGLIKGRWPEANSGRARVVVNRRLAGTLMIRSLFPIYREDFAKDPGDLYAEYLPREWRWRWHAIWTEWGDVEVTPGVTAAEDWRRSWRDLLLGPAGEVTRHFDLSPPTKKIAPAV